jgi:hypothetical protein
MSQVGVVLTDVHATTINISDVTVISGIADSQRLTRRHPSIFVERTELHSHLLAQLRAAISNSTSTAVVLRGPRGSGKPTIADDLCDRVEVRVHRVLASSETDLRSIAENDLVFVDGFMDDKGRYEAEAWIGSIPSRFFLITTRLSEATAAIQSALKNKGTQIQEIEVGGFSCEEFLEAVSACREMPGCAGVELSAEQWDRVFTQTGGLPLAVRILFDLFGSPTANSSELNFISALHPEEVLSELLKSWRQKVVEHDEELRLTLFALANVPIVGMSADAIAHVLNWSPERASTTAAKLWMQGYVSRVALSDTALRAHDAIRQAFLASGDESAFVEDLRKRYFSYCDSQSSSKSIISLTDSLMRASEYLFEYVGREDGDARPLQT